MGAFTDMLLPDKGSGEEAAKVDGSEEGEPLPGTARHREYYPEGIAEILKVMDILKFSLSGVRESFSLHIFAIESQLLLG